MLNIAFGRTLADIYVDVLYDLDLVARLLPQSS
jgi:hypothetical protein